eukprot:3791699-Pyramimonas_sp.AAC.1
MLWKLSSTSSFDCFGMLLDADATTGAVADALAVEHPWHLSDSARDRELVEHPTRETDKLPINR